MINRAVYSKYLRFCYLTLVFCSIIGLELGQITAEVFAIDENPPFSHYEVIEGRNIFKLAPKNDVVEGSALPVIEEVTTSKIGGFVLTGIIAIRGKYKAIIMDAETKKGFYVNVDDDVGDYTVEEITKNTVSLTKGGKTYKLKIDRKSSANKNKKNINEEHLLEEDVKDALVDTNENYKSQIIQSIRKGIPNVKR